MVLAPATRVAIVGLAVALGVGLSACVTPREPPPGPTESETAARNQQRADQAWANTGLEGTVDRPSAPVSSAPASFDELAECLDSSGLTDWGVGDGSDGPEFSLGGAGQNAQQQKLAFYVCFASHPADVMFGEVRLSDAQLDYLYDYYRSWVMPCLALDSVVPTRVPTRSEFTSRTWSGWNPYDYSELPYFEQEYVDAIQRCGPIYADLDVVDPFHRGEAASTISTFSTAQ